MKKSMIKTKEWGIKTVGVLMAAVIAVTSARAISGKNVYAVEFSVTEADAVLYSNDKTKVYNQPDTNSGSVAVIAEGIPVSVTGITSNGWFRISLDGIYYVPGDGLVSKNADGTNAVVSSTDITVLTKGTFSFFKNSELIKFDKNEVRDMDENTYIKYLDSFLMGYAVIDYCILQDSGKYLKEVYDSEAKVDKKVAAITMQTYLINYRNNYLTSSQMGPFKNESGLKLALNRAIRYNIGIFNAVYANTSIGSDETKIKKLIESVVSEMKAEQGVSFTYNMKYDTYKTSDGSEQKGWIIEFTKKD